MAFSSRKLAFPLPPKNLHLTREFFPKKPHFPPENSHFCIKVAHIKTSHFYVKLFCSSLSTAHSPKTNEEETEPASEEISQPTTTKLPSTANEETPTVSPTKDSNSTNQDENIEQVEEKTADRGTESSNSSSAAAEIQATREGKQIRLEWEAPEKALCDNYLVNTTILDLHKSLSTASSNPYSHIKFYNEQRLKV